MEIASNKGVIADASTPAGRAGMSESEWREAIKFDSTDTGWVIMSIGMAIGAGIVFLPVQVGLMGLWVFLLSSVIGYPAMYLFQRLFINTLAESPECKDGSDSNLLIVFYVQIMPDDLVMQLHRF